MEEIIKEFKHRLRWKDSTVIKILCEYLEQHQSEESLADFLEEKALYEESF